MERVKGIEPSSLAWEAKALPLSYTRITARLWRPVWGAFGTGGTVRQAGAPSRVTALGWMGVGRDIDEWPVRPMGNACLLWAKRL